MILWQIVALAVAATAGPMETVVAVGRLDVSASRALLSDRTALSWMEINRSADFPSMIQTAAQTADLATVLEGAADPIDLRRALDGRPWNPSAGRRTALERVAGQIDGLDRGVLATALLDWHTLSTERQDFLTAEGIVPEIWKSLELRKRVETLGKIFGRRLVAAHAAAENNATGELAAMSQFFDSARDLMSSDDELKFGLGLREGTLGPVEPDLDPEASAAAAAAIRAHLPSLVAGTDAAVLLPDDGSLSIRIDRGTPHVGYIAAVDAIWFNPAYLAEFERLEKRPLKDVAADPALAWRLAVFVAPSMVHELTHRRQIRLATARTGDREFASSLYHQGFEVEAYSFQTLFSAQALDRHPEIRALLQSWAVQGSHEVFGWADQNPVLGGLLAQYYANVPRREGALARFAALVGQTRRKAAALDVPIAAELARRRLLPPAERRRLQDHGGDDLPLPALTTTNLRRLAEFARPTTARAYAWGLEALAELRALEEATVGRRNAVVAPR